MRNGTFLSLYLLITALGAEAQADTTTIHNDTSYWKTGGINTLTSSQISLVNWAAGGDNSLSLNGTVSLFADYKQKRHSWENVLDLAYGLVRQGGGAFRKADDQFNLVTKYGYGINKNDKNPKVRGRKWYFNLLLDFRTQFFKGYSTSDPDSVISHFLAPAYLVTGMGFDYQPSNSWSFNYIPATGKFTIVNNQHLADQGAYGVPVGHKMRGEIGSHLRLKFKDDIFHNVNLESRIELFSNYVRNFGNVDVNVQNLVRIKINKWITVNYSSQLIYDDDINVPIDTDDDGVVDKVGPRVQLKSVLGAGLGVSIGATRDD